MGVKMDNSENLDGKKQEKKEEINEIEKDYFYDEEIKKFRYEDNPDKLCYYEDIADTHSYLHKFGFVPYIVYIYVVYGIWRLYNNR